jgi:hypothetical protein
VLDAAQDLLDLRYGRKLIRAGSRAAELRQALLERRAEIAVPSAPLVVPAPEARRPDRGARLVPRRARGRRVPRPRRVRRARGAARAPRSRRPAPGLPPYAQIEFLPARLRYYPEPQRLELDDLSLVKVVSLNPVSRWDQRPSWRMRAGATTVRDAGCAGCLAGVAEFGGGLAAMNLGRALDVVALADTELLGAPPRGIGGAGVRLGLGPALVRVRAGDRAVLLAEARWQYLPFATPDRPGRCPGRSGCTSRRALCSPSRRAPRPRTGLPGGRARVLLASDRARSRCGRSRGRGAVRGRRRDRARGRGARAGPVARIRDGVWLTA